MQQELIQILKQEIVKASSILRQTKVTQYYGSLTDNHKKYCALGAIYNYFGYDSGRIFQEDTDILQEQLGITAYTAAEIIYMNDLQHRSFTEIADWLEERGL